MAPLVFAAVTLASWAVRPADRRLDRSGGEAATTPRDWAIAVEILVLLLVASYLTLPKGRPPGL
ncbi:MAG TPA: hypothetical protein VN970_02670 [Thermoanaerobaculia bacterium]|nr:hypothetical protein [Thermoanaerobaculia bacterium]